MATCCLGVRIPRPGRSRSGQVGRDGACSLGWRSRRRCVPHSPDRRRTSSRPSSRRCGSAIDAESRRFAQNCGRFCWFQALYWRYDFVATPGRLVGPAIADILLISGGEQAPPWPTFAGHLPLLGSALLAFLCAAVWCDATEPVQILDVIIVRFANFLLLMGLLFVFAISIDVVVQFDKFSDTARAVAERDGRWYPLVLGRHLEPGPRIFQFFAFMTGLVGIAAAGFTLVGHRRSSWRSWPRGPLHRVVILLAQFGGLVQLLDQEFVLPRLAAKLVPEHNAILQPGIETFEFP